MLVYRLGDYHIAHLPPPAASVCAARWAADFLYLGEHSTAVWCMGAAAGMGAGAIRCGPFCGAAAIGWKEIQKPSVFGGVLFHISFAVERNMAAGGKKRKISGPLRPKVTRARERGTLPAGDMEET